MPRERPVPPPFEPEWLERSLNRYLAWGLAFMVLLVAGCSLLPGARNTALDGEWRLQAGTSQGSGPKVLAGLQPISAAGSSRRAARNVTGRMRRGAGARRR